MAKLIYSGIMSLDGYVADEQGKFDWSEPDEEVHAFINDLTRPVGTFLLGRRMYASTSISWTSTALTTASSISATAPEPELPTRQRHRCGRLHAGGQRMKNTTIPEPVGFSELTKAEQIRYLQSLWDRIAENPEELPVPTSHMELVEGRLGAYRRDPSQVHPAEEVLDHLSKRNR